MSAILARLLAAGTLASVLMLTACGGGGSSGGGSTTGSASGSTGATAGGTTSGTAGGTTGGSTAGGSTGGTTGGSTTGGTSGGSTSGGTTTGGSSGTTTGSSTTGGSSSGTTTGGTTTGGNVLPISVNSGINKNYANGVFATVTICESGSTTNCQTIDNVLVDTGSYGLRLVSSVVTVSLASQTNASGKRIGECTVFADGYSWGPVVGADVTLAGEKASSVPIQLMGAPSGFPSAPSACSSGNGSEEDTLSTVDANGILGVGVFAQDCGSYCSTHSDNNTYFACGSTSSGLCTSTAEALTSQVVNPVALFQTDNNGIEFTLPTISASGAVSAAGQVIFGIGTQSNNSLGSATTLTTDGYGDISAVYNNTSYAESFIDSGSNALFFASSNIPACSGNESDFDCPTSTLSLSATMTGQNGAGKSAAFSVANAANLFSNSSYAAFSNLAGGSVSTLGSGAFDFGLPFFYGRSIFFGIDNESTGTGQSYFAY